MCRTIDTMTIESGEFSLKLPLETVEYARSNLGVRSKNFVCYN